MAPGIMRGAVLNGIQMPSCWFMHRCCRSSRTFTPEELDCDVPVDDLVTIHKMTAGFVSSAVCTKKSQLSL